MMRRPRQRQRMIGSFAAIALVFVFVLVLAQTPSSAVREDAPTVAVTFDDLPAPPMAVLSNDVAPLRETTARLLASFTRARVPVVGFVNEGKLFVSGAPPAEVDARTAILKMWTDAGFELGNHTYAHRSLNATPLETFQEEVVRGETVTRRLMEERRQTLRYFRHPFLHVGLDLEKRRAFEAFLATRGYTIAPVTIDTKDYIYAAIYARALREGDRATASKAADEYVRSIDATFAYAERLAQQVAGRPIKHVLLCHANALNADRFDDVAAAITRRGYRFIPLQEALSDEAYRLPDTYVGNWGHTWLHHWEITAGKPLTPLPDPPDWITKAYTVRPR